MSKDSTVSIRRGLSKHGVIMVTAHFGASEPAAFVGSRCSAIRSVFWFGALTIHRVERYRYDCDKPYWRTRFGNRNHRPQDLCGPATRKSSATLGLLVDTSMCPDRKNGDPRAIDHSCGEPSPQASPFIPSRRSLRWMPGGGLVRHTFMHVGCVGPVHGVSNCSPVPLSFSAHGDR